MMTEHPEREEHELIVKLIWKKAGEENWEIPYEHLCD
jgi:hypothetical protein